MYDLNEIEGKNDLKIYWRGPGFSQGPTPAVIYLALSGPDSLLFDPINQPVEHLLKYRFNVFSFTLPGHGPGLDNKGAMIAWAKELENGFDFVEDFALKALQNIDFLVETRRILPDPIAIVGLSRGAFMAAHLMAKDDRIRLFLGFAPLTRLETLEEFQGSATIATANRLNLKHLQDKLSTKTLRFYIGNRDLRVGTATCFDLVETLTNNAYDKGLRSPNIEMLISPSIGHKGHGSSPQTFQNGIEWLNTKLRLFKEH